MAIKIDGVKRKVKPKLQTDRTGKVYEPKWDGVDTWTPQEFFQHRNNAMEYYRIESKGIEYKKWVINWANENSEWKKHVKQLQKCSDSQFNPTLGAVCRMLMLGMPLYDQNKAYSDYWESLPGTLGKLNSPLEFINARLNELLKTTHNLLDEIKETKDKQETAKQPTIQDRMNEIANKHILYFEQFEDRLMNGEAVGDPKAFDYLKAENCPQALIKKIAGFFEPHRQELIEARSGEDEQLKEAYSHYKAADYKRFEDFYSRLFADLESYEQVKRATKKAKVRKAPSKEKQVAKLKYLKEDAKMKLASINPVDILGAQQLWIYNTKNRKLGRYVADAHSGTLGVKGTTIIGFDQSQSIQKTLRKPEQQLKDFLKANKIELRKFIEGIKATDTKLNGRINADTILLKIL